MQLKWLAQKNTQAVDAVPEIQLLGTCVKSGQTTEYTELGRHARPGMYLRDA